MSFKRDVTWGVASAAYQIEGAPGGRRRRSLDGYFQWCFTDNFEWAMGDAIRGGLVYTDYPTQRRLPKDSAHWYREMIQTNGEHL